VKRLYPTSALGMLLIIDLIWQLICLYLSYGNNPTLLAPAGDALEYLNIADNIASGNFIQNQPFLSAPLYPYFVALMRSLGFGLGGIFVVQLLLRSLTAYIIANCAQLLFKNSGLAFASAACFLLLQEPAYFTVRLVNSSLQLLTLSFLIFSMLRFSQQPSKSRATHFGSGLGIAVLANPTLLASLPFFAWWLNWKDGRYKLSAIVLSVALGITGLATLHNAIAVGEFIPVSAQAGVTFAHGNSHGANGTYKPLAGVSANRLDQNKDAYDIVAEQTGVAGWGNTSDYYFKQGLDFYKQYPSEAFALILTKMRWLFAGKDYGDLFFITLENADPAFPRPTPHSAFIQVGWLLPMACIALVMLWRRKNTFRLPLFVLFMSAAATVIVFWYSPRYRLPLVPIAVIIVPWAIYTLADSKRWLAALLMIAPIAIIEGSSMIDDFDPVNAEMHGSYNSNIGLGHIDLEQYHLAIPRLEFAIANGQDKAVTHIALAESLVQIGTAFDKQGNISAANERYNVAIKEYYRALELNPRKDDARQSLVSVLIYMKRDSEATKITNEGKRIKSQ
jgi:tetratricopeptide (TPR) repeat protein